MVSVLGTEIITTMLGIIVLYFISISTSHHNALISPKWFVLFAGLFYGLALTTRSSYIFYFPAVLLYLFWANLSNVKSLAKSLFLLLSGMSLAAGIIFASYIFATGHFSMKILQTQNSFPFLSGTNITSVGQWNQDDEDLYFSWPSNERDKLARQEALARITKKPLDFLLLIPKKFFLLMAMNDYGNEWGFHGLNTREGKLIMALLSQTMHIIILLFAVASYRHKNTNLLLTIVLVVTLSTLLPHVVLEVQGRYHHYLMPFWILLAADGITAKLKTS